MMFMVFDVETTGLIKSKPYIVSIALKVFEVLENTDKKPNIKEVYDMYHIVKPPDDKYEIPIESTNVHGITTDEARNMGVSIEDVINELHKIHDVYKIDTIVAHNIAFDIGVLSLQVYRFDKNVVTFNDKIHDLIPYCTMKNSKELLKLEANTKTGRVLYKYPKLNELYEHFFPNEKYDEHNAKADVIACARCFFKMKYNTDIYS